MLPLNNTSFNTVVRKAGACPGSANHNQNSIDIENKRILASALLPKNHSIDSDRVVIHMVESETPKEIAPKEISLKETTKPKSPQNHLPLQTVQKMLDRFVVEKHLSIDEISHRLNIDTHKLRRLSTITYKHLASEICLPIIKLYCKTKWV
ncbi:MAG: hypothetical protein M1561_01975 [Gammaproteobacteria bacterium]|nr:hypothetical protein [Gammaproteobacteria bacterium]